MKVKEFVRFHQSRHSIDVDTCLMDLSYDGVAVSKSCGRSFEVLSGKFVDCRTVYPLSIGVAEKGFSDIMKAKEVMKSTLIKLRKCGICTNHWRMDHPKRAGMFGYQVQYVRKENLYFLSHSLNIQSAEIRKGAVHTLVATYVCERQLCTRPKKIQEIKEGRPKEK